MSRPRRLQASRALLAAFFTGAGTLHFTHPQMYERIMPPWVPLQREAVYASGVAEIAGGLAVLVPRLRGPARWGLLALLAAVFPANVHMALNPGDFKDIPEPLLWARLPLQGLAAWWVVSATRSDEGAPARAAAQAASVIRPSGS